MPGARLQPCRSAWHRAVLLGCVCSSFVQSKLVFLDSSKLFFANLTSRSWTCSVRGSVNKRVVFSNNAGTKYNTKHTLGCNRWGKARDSETIVLNVKSISHSTSFGVNIATFPNTQQCVEGCQGSCRSRTVNCSWD